MTWWLWAAGGIVLLFGFVAFRGAPYVPTRKRLLEKAFGELYPLSSRDVLVDIGCGDGVVLRAAARRGARAVGYELNPVLVLIAKFLSQSPLISVKLADFWLVKLPRETTIVFTFGESRDIKKMYEKAADAAEAYEKTIHFMSFGFPVPGEKAKRHDGSFYLYEIKRSLQQGKA